MQKNQIKKPKKLLIISDMAGYGRCSMTVALPVVSALAVQGCPVPTSLFSNHTAFPTFYKKDLTDCISPYLEHLSLVEPHMDGIYVGYLGVENQVDILIDYFSNDGNKNTSAMILIDPVMGDNGHLYSCIPNVYFEKMKKLIPYATIITPNLTEACLLTDTPFPAGNVSTSFLLSLAQKLAIYGMKHCIITGVRQDDCLTNFVYHTKTQTYDTYTIPIAGESRHGTGDLFAAMIAALSLRGFSLEDCVKKAANFVSLCTQTATDYAIPLQEGVPFELLLSHLINI